MKITVIHCFDHNYVLPAAVAFRTMLEHALTEGAKYELIVMGSGLNEADRTLLNRVVSEFANASLTFAEPPENPLGAGAMKRGGHYSADLYYKLMLPELFPGIDRAIVADADVIYLDDIATVWRTSLEHPEALVSGVWDLGYAACHGCGLFPLGRPLIRGYARKYTPEELERLKIGAGIMVYDMKSLRAEGTAKRWIDFAVANAHRAILPEQEAINLVCPDRISLMPLSYMAIAEHLPRFMEMSAEERLANPAWAEMFAAPVQFHYASATKPWKNPGSAGAGLWFEACGRAGLLGNWCSWFADYSAPLERERDAKKLLSADIGRFSLRLLKFAKERK